MHGINLKQLVILTAILLMTAPMAFGDSTTAGTIVMQYQYDSGSWNTLTSNTNSNTLAVSLGTEASPHNTIAAGGEGIVNIRSYSTCEAAANDAGDAGAPTGICTGDCGGTTYSNIESNIYTIDWDGDSVDCAAADGTWMTNQGTNVGSTPQCCGDDGSSDDWSTYSGTLTTSSTVTCSTCDNGVATLEAELYGNGYLSGTGTSRTCYTGDITCTSASYTNGASAMVYGWGYYSGDLAADTTIDCRSGAASCSDGSSASDSITALYGNGYVSGSTCYYGDMACSDGTETNGVSCTLAAEEICVADSGCNSCSPYQRSDTSTCYSDCSANDNADCVSGYHCDESSQCVTNLAAGTACIEDTDCSSDYCGSDYDDGKFCATSSTTCVHDGTNYASGTYLNGWTCSALSDGVWNDVTPPGKLTVGNVDGDASVEYWDTSDNSQTVVQLSNGESAIECRISTQNTNYDAMSSYVDCTGSPTVSCSLSISESSSYTYYIACQDEYGNDQTGVNITSVDFGVDWSEPTTYVSGYGGYYTPGHEVTLHEDDNIGDSVTILTWHCSPTSGCSPTTAIDNLDTITFNNRGTNYLRWYSRDAALNDQDIQEIQVEINSLTVITDSDMEGIVSPMNGYSGQNGGKVLLKCDGTDANSAIDGQNYSASVWLRVSGSGTWNKLSDQAMTWDGMNGYFYKEYSIADPYGTVYDMMCEITDDLGEASDNTETSIFTVLNSAPFVDDVWANESSPSKYSWMRWYCAGADIDNPVHLEVDLTATFSLTTRGDAWSLLGVENETMSWDAVEGEHYIDYYVLEDGDTHYDVRCQLNDGVDTSTLYVEMNATGAGNVNSTAEIQTQDDWDNDGVSDSIDTLEGTGGDLNTSSSVSILVDGASANTASGTKTVKFRVSGTDLVEFDYDFDSADLETPLITFERSTGAVNGVLVKGLAGVSKKYTLPIDIGTNQVCVKNAEVSLLSDITEGCNGANEVLFAGCGVGGQTIGDVTCTKVGDNYEVTGLTNSAIIEFGNARLEIWSEGTFLLLDEDQFYANYSNSTSGVSITGGDCNIWFTDTGWVDMNFDGTLWNYNKTFDTPGGQTYNVSCTHATYTNLATEDSFIILTAAIPEFSTMTLGLGLVVILAGLFLIRRKR